MKKLLSIFAITMLLGGSAFAQNKSIPPAKVSSIKFEEVSFDFGQMPYASTVSHVFTFKNVSNAPVAIKDVGTSCGCTTSGYSKEPVAPGKSGSVTAKYDSSRLGAFNKTLTVWVNDEQIKLTIRGTILPPKSDKSPSNNGQSTPSN